VLKRLTKRVIIALLLDFICKLEINPCVARVRLKYILKIFSQMKIIIMINIIIYSFLKKNYI
jgi:hypothetical protein